jgi:uncharacterized lipoprotein NlpE involved in copper resistance
MKRVVFIFSVVCLLFQLSACKSKSKKQTESNVEVQSIVDDSGTGTDWKGTYAGVLPCAGCSGIETQIILNDDNTYQISWKYRDRDDQEFTNSGTIRWDDQGGVITLENLNKDQYPTQYRVGENHLRQLDMEGNAITGDLSEMYILAKVQQE